MIAALQCLALFVTMASAAYQWIDYQNIIAHGANDWEAFQFDNSTFIAVSNYEANSVIYQWNYPSESFVEFQNLKNGLGCSGITFLNISGEYYIVVANIFKESWLYKYETFAAYSIFKEYQQLNFNETRKWKSAIIGGQQYIATTGGNRSVIYSWNVTSSQFEFFQQLPLVAPQELVFYNIEQQSYLAVANGEKNPSAIYLWNGMEFELFQNLSTTGGSDIIAFEINSVSFVAVASLDRYVDIFQWSVSQGKYTLFQTLLGKYLDFSLTQYSIQGTDYLVVATVGSFPKFEGDAEVYLFAEGKFKEYQAIPTLFTEKMAVFSVENDYYMAAAYIMGNFSLLSVPNPIFKWVQV